MLMATLPCSDINNITPEVKVCIKELQSSMVIGFQCQLDFLIFVARFFKERLDCFKDFYEQKQQAEPYTEYGSDGETVECCRVDGRTIPRVWTQPRVREHTGSGSNMIRLLMWNPENLAQRLDLDKAVSKGRQTRMNSPTL